MRVRGRAAARHARRGVGRACAWASSTRSSAARRSSRAAGARPAVRDVDGVRHARRPATASTTKGVAAIVFQPLATADFEAIVAEMEELLARHRRGHRDDDLDERGRARLPLDRSCATTTSRTSSSASTPSATRSWSAATATACWPRCSPSRTPRAAPSTSSTTTSAATGIRSCRRGHAGARRRARAADQGDDRRRAADRARARALVSALGDPDLVSRGVAARRRPRACARESRAPSRGCRRRACRTTPPSGCATRRRTPTGSRRPGRPSGAARCRRSIAARDDRQQPAERAVDAAGRGLERRLVGAGEAQRQPRAARRRVERSPRAVGSSGSPWWASRCARSASRSSIARRRSAAVARARRASPPSRSCSASHARELGRRRQLLDVVVDVARVDERADGLERAGGGIGHDTSIARLTG